ncbi:putative polyketide synthase [Xylaria digitata]|nr:putative polyketide synthase [Xylaria digitata]
MGKNYPESDGNAIAIVGVSAQLPGADSVESLWDLILSGRRAVSRFPESRLCSSKFHRPDESWKGSIRPQHACFLERDISVFDAKFFAMTKEEAVGTDPQQRLLLETTYRALESAGITLESINGSKTSVHTGFFTADYMLASAKDPENGPKYSSTGMAGSMLSNRISTFFNLTGPSISIDTACSSSLVALDLACKSILQGDSSMGIVAGCNLLLTVDYFISLSSLGFLSPDGTCHSFDNRANGYGRGEGVGVLILKPLESALRDNDTIRAVIRATGSNQNGRTSLAQPSKEMQMELIDETYRRAGLDPSLTRYFEAHGTGTAVGDPLEAMAIGNTFGSKRGPDDPMLIGSVKANIGHLEGAAGIAGVIKAILVLEKGVVPPIAGLKELNKNIDAKFLNLEFPRIAQPWPWPGLRRISVNSFGFGGTNSHVILDDALHYLKDRCLVGNHLTNAAPDMQTREDIPNGHIPVCQGNDNVSESRGTRGVTADVPKLFVWSASDYNVAIRLVQNYQEYLSENSTKYNSSDINIDDLAYTLAERRSHQLWRSFQVSNSLCRLSKQLRHPRNPVQAKSNRKLGFVFTGQGAQWLGMGRDLFSFSAFRESVEDADKILQSLGCPWRAEYILRSEADATKINDPRFAQPLCTVLQIALIELLRSFDIHPSLVVGHSSGEIAAAYAFGGISKHSALKLSYYRGIVSASLADTIGEGPRGSMMAVGASGTIIQRYIDEILASSPKESVLAIACVNSPMNVTVSGDHNLIELLKSKIQADGVFNRLLHVPVAYHSPHMLKISSEYQELVGDLEPGSQSTFYTSMVSSVTSEAIPREEVQTSEYWVKNMVSPVYFATAMQLVARNSVKEVRKKLDLSHRNFTSVSDLIEIGPHSALQGPIREITKAEKLSENQLAYFPAQVRSRPGLEVLLELVGNLHCVGYKINLSRVNNPTGIPISPRMAIPTLPEYPFDHTQSYWEEPRISRSIRLPQYPPSEFLGVAVADWNPLEPRWRNTLKKSSIGWLEDHKINGEILYPAAGMLVMAIEAAAQISDVSSIIAYEIRDVEILSALSVSQDESGVEIEMCLRPSQDSSSKSTSWSAFSLYAHQSPSSVEICRGFVRVISDFSNQGEFNEIIDGDADYVNGLVESSGSPFSTRLDSKELYETFADSGYRYGPSFQQIDRIIGNNNGQALGSISIFVPPVKFAGMPTVVHPATLDSMLQLILPAAVRRGDRPRTWIPTYISKLWISATGLLDGQAQVWASTKIPGARLCISTIYATKQGSSVPIVRADGIESTVVSDEIQAQGTNALRSQARRLCWDLIQKPDVALLDNVQVLQYAQGGRPPRQESSEYIGVLKSFVLQTFIRSLEAVSECDVPMEPPHLRRQYSWVRQTIAANQLPHVANKSAANLSNGDCAGSPASREYLSRNRVGNFHVTLGRHIPDLLGGTTDLPTVLAKENMVQDYHDLFLGTPEALHSLVRYLDLMAHKNPGMRILEIGGATGTATRSILSTLVVPTSNGPFCRFYRYDYTDTSTSFFDAASREFESVPNMHFTIFHLEEDAVKQGFEEHYYDVVICCNVVETMRSLRSSLAQVRRLLKDEGKVIFASATNPESLVTTSLLGYLPEYWNGVGDSSDTSSCTTVEAWSLSLLEQGFTRVEIISNNDDCPETQSCSILVSTIDLPTDAQKRSDILHNRPIYLIYGWEESPRTSVIDIIISTLNGAYGAKVQLSNFRDASARELDESLIIIVQGTDWPSLGSLSSLEYNDFHSVLNRVKNILWVTHMDRSSEKATEFGIVQGMARAVRMEKHDLIFATVFLDSSNPTVLPQNLEKSLDNFFNGVQQRPYERELVQVGELLHIPRVYEYDELNTKIYEQTSGEVWRQRRLADSNVQLKIRQVGLLDTLYFEEMLPANALRPDEIEVEVRSIGVNFKDCLVALGRVAEESLGTECAGIVQRVGLRCQLKPGDRVLVSTVDTFKSVIRCSEKLAAIIPEGISFTEAGALVTNFVTAYHSLVTLGRLSPGESVLIHSGAGGTGQAAIQIAQLRGAVVYTTVGTTSKQKLLTDLYGIPRQRIFSSRTLSFAENIKRLTNQKGVDVVLNSLAGDALVASWECIAPYGRFIEIGKKDIFSHSKLPMFQFAKNVSFSAVDVGAMTYEKPDLIGDALKSISDLFSHKALRMPSPITAFPLSQVESAFRHLQSGTNAGKVVVEISPDDKVSVAMKPSQSWNFDSCDTFVIAGGLGGQGRSIAEWMVSRGARHLVLLSRSGPDSSEKVKLFVERLKSRGTTVYCPKCDVADTASLAAVIDYCKANMPPIKGCIQAAMNIQDTMFENMTFRDWSASLRPKVQGTWNLHRLLPRNLDFFVIFSSVAAIIGSQGQSNYAAANAFEDELARYRLSQGEKAISLNLSLLAGEGYAVQNQKVLMQFMAIKQMLLMSQAEVFAILDHYCNKDLPFDASRSQVVMGLDVPSDIIARGMEPSAWAQEPLFANLGQITGSNGPLSQTSSKDTSSNEMELASRIQNAASPTEAASILTEGLVARLCRILSISPEEFDRSQPMHMYGVDSLIAVELRNWFLKTMKVDIAVFEILGGATADMLGKVAAEKMQP